MEKKKIVFISGPMTGHKNYNREAFINAESKLLFLGYVPLNPARLPDGLTREAYMRIDQAMLKEADAIYLLPGWKGSSGASEEKALAEMCGLQILEEYKTDLSPFELPEDQPAPVTNTSDYVFTVGSDEAPDFETESAETCGVERVMTATDLLRIMRSEMDRDEEGAVVHIYPEDVMNGVIRFFTEEDEEAPF